MLSSQKCWLQTRLCSELWACGYNLYILQSFKVILLVLSVWTWVELTRNPSRGKNSPGRPWEKQTIAKGPPSRSETETKTTYCVNYHHGTAMKCFSCHSHHTKGVYTVFNNSALSQWKLKWFHLPIFHSQCLQKNWPQLRCSQTRNSEDVQRKKSVSHKGQTSYVIQWE